MQLTQQLISSATIYGILMLAVYLYGRSSFPKKALQLAVVFWMLLVGASMFSYFITGLAAIPVICTLLYILRKPDSTRALRQFYIDKKIFTVTNYLPDVLDVLGDKKWRYAEGTLLSHTGSKLTNYFFWRGCTVASVPAGQFARGTSYTHYLAFIFPADTVSDKFKEYALAATDRSGYSVWQKIKFFFVHDTNKPYLVSTAADRSFIISFFTEPDVKHYSKQLDWIRTHFQKAPVAKKSLIAA